ncbi:MAG: hypothetical protein KAT86_06745 [Candidatus Latescibacteria bacterium]|nr:hypothetical protein [Candidatus Latescibacterota bacterium]
MSPEKRYHRRSVRLNGYDYFQPGAYFVTICVQSSLCLLDNIDVRVVVQRWWDELHNKFPNVDTDAFVIMPNHIHGVIIITYPVGAHLRVRPESSSGQTHRSAPTVGNIIQWFKTMTTNEYIHGVKQYGWTPFPGRLWQRNYYEHIIRNEDQLNSIREYIHLNPLKWELDRENPNRKLDQAYENQWKWLEGIR